jgi:hypothetical protein
MRVLCPSCQQLITLPDTAAGQMTPCPQCGKAFTPPAMTGAAIDAAPPPAPVMPPPRPTESYRPPESIVVSQSPASKTDRDSSCTCTLHKRGVRWIAPVALFLVFLLTFATWMAASPNGTKVYTQSGWQAMTGSFTVADFVGDGVLGKEHALRAEGAVSGWLLVFMIFLILTTLLAIGGLVIELMALVVPDVLAPVWPHRNVLIAGLCALLLISLGAPMISGFGLESAAALAAEKEVPPVGPKQDKPAPGTKELQERDLRRDVAVNGFAIHRTYWLCTSLLLQLIALVGASMMVWLNHRGDRPEPRVEWYC